MRFKVNCGSKIKLLRRDRRWTRQELYERSGVSPDRIARLERGESMPTLELMMKLAEAMGVGVDEVLV